MNLTEDYKIIDAGGEEVFLMCAGVSSEEVGVVDVVGIALAAGDVVLGDVEGVEVVLDADDWTQLFVTLRCQGGTVNLLPRLFLICSLMMQMGWFSTSSSLRSARLMMFSGMLK